MRPLFANRPLFAYGALIARRSLISGGAFVAVLTANAFATRDRFQPVEARFGQPQYVARWLCGDVPWLEDDGVAHLAVLLDLGQQDAFLLERA